MFLIYIMFSFSEWFYSRELAESSLAVVDVFMSGAGIDAILICVE